MFFINLLQHLFLLFSPLEGGVVCHLPNPHIRSVHPFDIYMEQSIILFEINSNNPYTVKSDSIAKPEPFGVQNSSRRNFPKEIRLIGSAS